MKLTLSGWKAIGVPNAAQQGWLQYMAGPHFYL